MTIRQSFPKAGALVVGLGSALLMASAGTASAQNVDARWLPWLGCWAPVEALQEADMLCVRPADQPGAVEALRVSGGAVESREVLFADGARHATDRGGCEGWEEGSFSRDQRRVFMRFEHVCEGGREQDGGGIMVLAAPDEWLDVRVMGLEGERTAWVQRYYLVDQETAAEAGFGDIVPDELAWDARTARMLAAASLDIDDVIEASSEVPAEAVVALLAQRGDRFPLEAKEIVRMADAGVPDEVIDVAVAVSFPDRFALAAGTGPERAPASATHGGYRSFMSPFGFDPFYMPWSLRYGYGYGFGYGYGYPYGGWYGGYGYRPAVVVVDRAQEHGRVIRGRGYTRSRGGSSAGVSGGSYIPRSAPSAGSAGSGSGSSRPASSGRTAKPRGGR